MYASTIADVINSPLKYYSTVYILDFGRPCTHFIYKPAEK